MELQMASKGLSGPYRRNIHSFLFILVTPYLDFRLNFFFQIHNVEFASRDIPFPFCEFVATLVVVVTVFWCLIFIFGLVCIFGKFICDKLAFCFTIVRANNLELRKKIGCVFYELTWVRKRAAPPPRRLPLFLVSGGLRLNALLY